MEGTDGQQHADGNALLHTPLAHPFSTTLAFMRHCAISPPPGPTTFHRYRTDFSFLSPLRTHCTTLLCCTLASFPPAHPGFLSLFRLFTTPRSSGGFFSSHLYFPPPLYDHCALSYSVTLFIFSLYLLPPFVVMFFLYVGTCFSSTIYFDAKW